MLRDPTAEFAAGAEASDRSWGERLRSFRLDHLQISRKDFAELINARASGERVNVACSERHVARWEDGDVRTPSAPYRRLLVAIGAPVPHHDQRSARARPATDAVPVQAPMSWSVGSGVSELGRAPEATLLEAVAAAVVGSASALVPWLPRLDEAEATDRVGRGRAMDADGVRSATAHLRSLDQQRGGFAVTGSATALLGSIPDLRKLCRDETADQAILVASADLARLIGWAFHDAGDQYRARQFATLALVFARRAGADSLTASILYVLGRISVIERDPRTALRMFQLGQLPARDAADGGESARLYANEAWAHAMLGDQNRMNFALACAEDEINRVGDIVAPWTRVFFTPGEFTGIQAVIYNEYATTAPRAVADRYCLAALDSARVSLQASAPGRPARSILFDNITAATACFRLGEIDTGLSFATAAVEMAERITSARVADRLENMVRCATTATPRSDVRDLSHAVKASLLAIPRASHHPTTGRATSA
ncbi:hypothetical protein [Nocardia asiatica]|uniref:hypothetical protein n=1 Tax=Nocardia asiatica TaxID=209252 RepID=UPI0002D96394|nr:hypothetical protein [Nocardia asiatica]